MNVKQLSSFMALSVNGGTRISYTYDVINGDTGEPVSTNNKSSFYVVDPTLQQNVDAIREYIRTNKLAD